MINYLLYLLKIIASGIALAGLYALTTFIVGKIGSPVIMYTFVAIFIVISYRLA